MKARSPFWFSHIIDDDPKMAEVKRDVFNLRSRKYDRLPSRMRKAEFIKDVRIFAREVR